MKSDVREIQSISPQIKNPIVAGGDVIEEKRISLEWLVAEYKRLFDIDITYLIPDNCILLSRYRCVASGYRFYEPASIVGDSKFYEKLQQFKWYYMPDKWEFHEALQHIPASDVIKVLEIGSAKGDFMNMLRLHNPNASVTGLELNENAAQEAIGRGLDAIVMSSNIHMRKNMNSYDVVVSFQVLEHVPNPMDILNDAVNMLKVGGKLIVCVPDNSRHAHKSIFLGADLPINMPPHHQGLWDIPSLAYLSKILPLQLNSIIVEPAIYSHHSNSYRGLLKKDLLNRFGKYIGWIIYAIARPFYNHALNHLNIFLPAHSLLAVFIKNITSEDHSV